MAIVLVKQRMMAEETRTGGTGQPHRKRGFKRFGPGNLMPVMLVPLFAFILLLGISSCSSPQEPSEPAGEPRLSFEKDFIDLGTAKPGQELHVEFHFQNAGDAPLVIKEITTEAVTEGC